MEEARKKAYQILNGLEIVDVPVDVDYIAQKLDCKIFKINPMTELPEDFPCDRNNFAGAIIDKEDGTHSIFVNKFDTLKRQKFTIAHELGHLVLGSGQKIDCRESMYSNEHDELAANEFAGNLIMPEEWIRSIMSITSNKSKLADIFQVSLQAMETRLYKLGL